MVQPVAFRGSFLQSQISIDDLLLQVSFATFRWKETNGIELEIEIEGHSKCNMRWLRLVGSIKLQVSFEKEPYKRDDILQKRPII